MNELQDASGSDGTSVERMCKLIKDFQKQEKPRTGDGTKTRTEMDLLLEFCIRNENKTKHCKKKTQEKEFAAKAIVLEIREAALRTIPQRKESSTAEGKLQVWRYFWMAERAVKSWGRWGGAVFGRISCLVCGKITDGLTAAKRLHRLVFVTRTADPRDKEQSTEITLQKDPPKASAPEAARQR